MTWREWWLVRISAAPFDHEEDALGCDNPNCGAICVKCGECGGPLAVKVFRHQPVVAVYCVACGVDGWLSRGGFLPGAWLKNHQAVTEK